MDSVDNSPFLRVAHTAHSPYGDGDGVGTFSIVKWVLFQLSRFRSNSSSGYFFDCQVGTFSIDKNMDERMRYYNTERRHSSIDYVPPLMYIKRARSKGEE